ncbi:hypothetical protein NQ315_008474 [Exocentrus adspersus]|uniref:Uncharacterized protein n=1 Tax=Exocentrus adspersus TaxID=1586481 RepID=A0AAV8W5F1_9CUCU|nr:hypothetical protein NQ315_008474 [Exocentrus adspersus]
MSVISNATISKIPGISETRHLEIKFSPNLEVRSNSFKSATKIRTLIISHNRIINKIYRNSFQDLPVHSLKLTNNSISSIFPRAFSNLSLLEALQVDYNNLQEIPTGVFVNLPVKSLKLSHNKIFTIKNAALEDLSNLNKLMLDHNNLETIFLHKILKYPQRLEILWLHNNSLTAVSNYMLLKMNNLKILNLGFNPLTSIEPNSFSQTPKLNYLVLTNTHLKEIDGNVFPRTGMDYLENMYLDNSKLMYLKSNFFVGLGSLRKVTLVGNPWLCPCLTAVERILAENNVREMCAEAYTNGSRPICVNDQVNNECKPIYNEALSEKYERYKTEHPFYTPTINCIL